MSARASGVPPGAVVIASSNRAKVEEIRAILADLPFELCGLDACPPIALPEEGDDYAANAVAKALTVARAVERLALADDSGLEVEVLDGAPGPRSARFGGPGLDDAGRVSRLLDALSGVAPERRAARFVCSAALATRGGEVVTARGECTGRILDAPRGRGGFGYDPIFEVTGRGAAMAELEAAEKNRISHRARAFLALREALLERARC